MTAILLRPYAAQAIGSAYGHGDNKNETAQLLGHFLLGAVTAYVNGSAPLIGGSSAVAAEKAAAYWAQRYNDGHTAINPATGGFDPNLLPEPVKAEIRSIGSAVAGLAAAAGGSAAGNSVHHTLAQAQTASVIGMNAVENNYLTANTIDKFKNKVLTRTDALRLFKSNQNNLLSQCGASQASTQCRDAARYTLAFINDPDAVRHFPEQVEEAIVNLSKFNNIPAVKSFNWQDYTRGIGKDIIAGLSGKDLPSGQNSGYVTGIVKSLAGTARDAQIPGGLLYGSPVGIVGDNQWLRADPYEISSKEELWGSYIGAVGGLIAAKGTPRVGALSSSTKASPPAKTGALVVNRQPSQVDGEMAAIAQKPTRGAIRAQEYGSNWQEADLTQVIRKFVGNDPSVRFTPTGKAIYSGKTNLQVVLDIEGNYFRIENTNITGRHRYLDLNGNIPSNKINSNGKQQGRNLSEYNEVTHFRVKNIGDKK